MGQPTGYVGVVSSCEDQWADSMIWVMTSWLTVKWWANGSADRVFWSNDQSANSRVVGLMDWPTGYIGVMTSWPTVGLE